MRIFFSDEKFLLHTQNIFKHGQYVVEQEICAVQNSLVKQNESCLLDHLNAKKQELREMLQETCLN